MLTPYSSIMDWVNLAGKGLFSGAVIVAASEIAKRSAVFGALVISLPLASIMSMTWLYNDTEDTAQVADFAESILWLVIPSMLLFVVLPYLLRRGWGFEAAMAVGIVATIIAYGLGVWAAQTFSQVS